MHRPARSAGRGLSSARRWKRTGEKAASAIPKEHLNGTEIIAGRIAGYLKDYDVDIIEVIGYTDEQPLAGLPSNLDKVVSAVLANEMPISAVQPSDNAGLGLARAIAVTEILRSDSQLAGTTVLPLSAAQLIMPGDVLSDGKQAGSVDTRRRIEIRVCRRQDPVAAERPSARP
ncbi:hypothetical protein [Mesorhizobium sp. M0199]|uniref:hypothetical protein n=1 Tax=Mesorhizobium sp. M0199 TaxID=2956911 RepID=UPI003335EE24